MSRRGRLHSTITTAQRAMVAVGMRGAAAINER